MQDVTGVTSWKAVQRFTWTPRNTIAESPSKARKQSYLPLDCWAELVNCRKVGRTRSSSIFIIKPTFLVKKKGENHLCTIVEGIVSLSRRLAFGILAGGLFSVREAQKIDSRR